MDTLFGILFWCAVICLVARWYDRHARRKVWKPKKKGFLESLCDGDVTYPGYTVRQKD